MDGPHDLGGKELFGPIETDAPPFRADWERRQWALSKTMQTPPIPLDWFRHATETIPPGVYLSVPYFQKWNAVEFALAIDNGVFTMAEVRAGRAARPSFPAPVKSLDDLAEQQRASNRTFAVSAMTLPEFAVGQLVITNARPSPGHTRLPAYARAAVGMIVAHHGAHLYPDAGARGEHIGHHLYTVEFRAGDLWPDPEDPADTICLDLWEPYLAAP